MSGSADGSESGINRQRLAWLWLWFRYNAIKTYWNDDGNAVLGPTLHMAAATEAGK